MMLVTLDLVLAHLKLPAGPEDADLTLKIEQASALVWQYLKRPWPAGSPLGGSPLELTEEDLSIIQAATLKVVGNLYRFRGDDERVAAAPISPEVIAMLSHLRDPALA